MSRFAGKELRPQEGVSVSCWRPQKNLVRKSRRKNRLLDRKGFDIFVTINIAQVILFVPDLPFESIRFLFLMENRLGSLSVRRQWNRS